MRPWPDVPALASLRRRVCQLTGATALAAFALLAFTATRASADDLVIDLDVDPPLTVNAGESFTFALEVFEDDGSTDDVVMSYFIPAGLEVLDVSSSSGDVLDCMAGTPGDHFNPLACRLGELDEDDDPIIITIEVRVDPAMAEGAVIDTDAQVCEEDDDATGNPSSTCEFDDFPPDNELHFFTTVTTEADLAIRKSVSPAGPINAGEDLTYQVEISNAGPSVARGVVVADRLPEGVIFKSAQVIDATGGAEVGGEDLTCTLAANNGPAGTVGCELGDIPPGQPAGGQKVVVIEVSTDPGMFPTPAVLTNEAEVSSSQTDDPDLANNTSTVDTTVNDRAQIEVRKSSSPLHPVAGETFLYTYEVESLGPSDARNVLFTDTLPQGLAADGSTVYFEYVDDEANGFCTQTGTAPDTIECRPAGNAFTNPPYVLPAEETVTFSVLVRIPPELQPGSYTNLAGVGVGNANFSITSFGDDVEVRSVADLKIQKFVSPHNPVRAGEQFTYTILVDNLGPSTAYNIVVTDTLISSGFVDANGCSLAVRTSGGLIDEFNCNFSLSTGVFDLGTFGATHLNPRSTTDMGRVIITINATADQPMDLTDTVTVTSDSEDPDTSNNMATVAHSVSAVSDIEVTKQAMGEVVAPACGTSWIVDPNDPQAFPAAGFNASATNVTAGRRIEYTLTVTNNGPSHAENVTVSDRLPAGVTVVPGSVVVSQGSCQTGTPGDPDDRLTCGLGTLAVGDTETVTFQVVTRDDLPPGMALENDVFASADQFDNTNANNYAFTQTIVNTWADTEITKLSVGQNKTGYDSDLQRFIFEDLPGQVTAGHELRYEITVQNRGPSVARNAQVLDLLPGQTDTGLDHDPVTFLRSDGAYCRPADELQEIGVFSGGGGKFGQVLWCSVGDLAPGERTTFDIYVRVDPAVPDATTLTNGAFVWWGESSPPAPAATFLPFPFPQIPPVTPITDDPCLDNNFASTETEVKAVADVYIQKVDVPATDELDRDLEPDLAIAGDEHRYKITFGNLGWSVARDIAIQDFLDFKQFQILGETFVRCEPFDIDDFVSCSENNGIVDLDLLLHQNEQVVPGDLSPGAELSFYLITEVDPGYVLDADDFIATNDSRITTTTTDFHTANNVDAHDTEIIGRADLAIEKVDDAAGFLTCDPVEPGGMITYDLTVTNEGPSDAADVYVVDQLPVDAVVADPAQVVVTVSAGEVVEVRDDGQITVRVGNDDNNEGDPELGRLNAGSTETITIRVMVRQDAECGSTAQNVAVVETRENAAAWPPAPDLLPGVGGGPRTPTVDPNPTNNRATEETAIECPAVQVVKTVSFDGQCPGIDLSSVFNQTGQPVTYCYAVTNVGTTYLDTIFLTDTLDTRTTMPTVIFTDTITASPEDPQLPLGPGETVKRQVTVPHVSKECGTVVDAVDVSATAVNSGRTVLPCLGPVTGSDDARIDVPCDGVDWRLQLPILSAGECDAWVQVQNVGDRDTKAMVVFWGEAGACPPQSAGPLKVECSGLLAPGTAWSFAANQIPVGANSGMVYTLPTDKVVDFLGQELTFADLACMRLFNLITGSHEWWWRFDTAYRAQQPFFGPFGPSGEQLVLPFDEFQGEPLAATVNRTCPDPVDENISVNAAYRGISSDEEGARDPVYSGYTFYSPLVFASRGELNSTLHIHNSGDECTSLEIWFAAQDDCLRPVLGDVLSLAPGETVSFDPNTVVGPDWLGGAWIRASQPLGIVVDTMAANHFTSYAGVPADVFDLGFSLGNQINYAPLIYSEYQGWDSVLQVQNMSGVMAAKVKVYFLDRSGDIITTLVDWVCPRGSQSFFLPVIGGLPGNWVGSARAESQEWWSPGQPLVDPPRIQSVVLLEKWSDPARTQRREAVAYNAQEECLLYDWQLGSGKGGTASGSAVFAVPLLAKGNRGVTTELGITNLVPKPGFTDFVVYFYDQNGMVDYICQKLNEKQVEYVDLNTWGSVPRGYLGSAVVSATFWEHPVFDDRGGFQRNLVGLGGAVLERVGGTLGGEDVPGDESKAYESFPIFDHFRAPVEPVCPGTSPRLRP